MPLCTWRIEISIIEKKILKVVAVEEMKTNYFARFLNNDTSTIRIKFSIPQCGSCHSEGKSKKELL